MAEIPRNRSVKRKALDYFKFLSYYERDLFVDAPVGEGQAELSEEKNQSVKEPSRSSLNPYPSYAPYTSLAQMEASIQGCLRCRLGTTRTKFVFGTGSPQARVVFIGEAPGQEEDRRGEPFVGRAGELLNHLLEKIGWRRQDVYICNILKCRPPNNRDPLPDEIGMCEPFLHEQLRLLDPDWLVALGRVSAQVLLQTTAPLKAMRGQVHKYRGKPFWVTYHTAALLRNPNLMPDAHQDLLTLKQMMASGHRIEGNEI